MKFYGLVGYNSRTYYDLNDRDPKSRSLEVKMVKIVSANNSVHICPRKSL